jgi:spore maturation protein CgeB
VYETLFHENEHYVAFRQDLSDFDEKLRHYLRNDAARQAVVDRAHEHVMRNHIWSVRVRELTDEVQKRLL